METNKIHETAILENVRFLGVGNEIGPYCVIKDAVIGHNNVFGAYVSIGAGPEIKGPHETSYVQIGSDNVFSEFVTVHKGSKNPTVIWNRNLFFVRSHVAHDCWIGSGNIIGGASLAGHVKLLGDCFVAGTSGIHQFVVVGRGAMIGAGVHVERHVEPYVKIAGRMPAVIGYNERAMKGISDADLACAKMSFTKEIERHDPTNRTDEIRAFAGLYESRGASGLRDDEA
jgi:UDP-N-acetylglucosamine acyltransferase